MAIHFSSLTKENRYLDLINSIQYCDLCDKLCYTKKSLSLSNGNINSKIFFISNYPIGSKTTNDTNHFEMLLSNVGWKKENVFYSYALLCSPKEIESKNYIPSSFEIKNCNIYLEMLINLIQPEVIVTLGSIALEALYYIKPHNIELNSNVGEKISWNDKIVIPLYDPNQFELEHRSLSKQRADFMSLAKYVNPTKGILLKKKVTQKNKCVTNNTLDLDLMQVIVSIVSRIGELSYFKLAKLLYFVDLTALERFGETITGSIYLRQQDGPWPPNLSKVIKKMNGYEILYINKKIPTVSIGKFLRFEMNLDEVKQQIIFEVISKYANMNNSALKIAVYISKPMRYVLKQEKLKRDMRKIPIIYKNKTVIDLDNVSK